MTSLLSKLLPLAADPFPPTHKVGSEFEGFFIRLESHSGRSQQPARPFIGKQDAKGMKKAQASPSRIPKPTTSHNKILHPNASSRSDAVKLRHGRRSSSSSDASSSSESAGPPSPTPEARNSTIQTFASPLTRSNEIVSPRTMLTEIEPVFASPESYLSPRSTSTSQGKKSDNSVVLPTSAPGDLILVVCELLSAPIDQRICIYLRWIVHGEEPALHQALHQSSIPQLASGGSRLPSNETDHKGIEQLKSFEIIKFVPSWQLKLGRRAPEVCVQPFRIDLPDDEGDGSLGFMEIKGDGNLVVDLTLPNRLRSQDKKEVGTRVRLRSTRFCPWHPSGSSRLPMGSRGPEGWIQHLGGVLPLHWYVHSSPAPAMFSLEHLTLFNGNKSASEANSFEELDDAAAAGRGLLHVEKNWGQAFPSGWMWAHAASPLPDPCFTKGEASSPSPFVRLSLAGGSILGLTAFLIGIHIRHADQQWEWNFAPPFALGPQISFPSKTGGKLHYGLGLRMQRDFKTKSLHLNVWDLTRWASIQINGKEDTFATQIPGPCKNGWSPAYCHHSYRCKATITLYQRTLAQTVTLPIRAALNPRKTIRTCTNGWNDTISSEFGWKKLIKTQLDDRVALEFGGDFAQ